MEQDFEPSMAFVFSVEGGYSNDPRDPGGITNLGVTLAEWQLYVGRQMVVTDGVMRSLTQDDVRPLYHSHYWNASRCSDLPAGVDLIVFDASVNTGCGRSIRALQDQVGAVVDGIIGPHTLAAVNAIDPEQLIAALAAERLQFYQSLNTWSAFGHGWTDRVKRAQAAAENLVTTSTGASS